MYMKASPPSPPSKEAAVSLKTEGESKSFSSLFIPKEVSSTGSKDCPWIAHKVRPSPFSLLERGEFMEGVPEQGRLPLGFRQGKHLLLRDTGGYGDVALMNGVQALVWWGCGASTVA